MRRHIFQAADLQKFANDLFVAAGTPQHIADNVAEILIKANLAGHDSHGVLRIPSYLEGIEGGGIQPAAEPNILRETDNTLHIDGERGFGHYAARYAIRARSRKKRKTGVPASLRSFERDISVESVNTRKKPLNPDVLGLLP